MRISIFSKDKSLACYMNTRPKSVSTAILLIVKQIQTACDSDQVTTGLYRLVQRVGVCLPNSLLLLYKET
jgi:hypothetical protein